MRRLPMAGLILCMAAGSAGLPVHESQAGMMRAAIGATRLTHATLLMEVAVIERFQIKHGAHAGGDTVSLEASDNDSLEVDSEQRRGKYRTMTVVHLTSPFTGVTRLDLRVETGANRSNITTRVHMYDNEDERWRLVKKFRQTRGDRSRRWADLPMPDRYVRDGDRRIKVRITTLHRDKSHTIEVDHVEVVVRN